MKYLLVGILAVIIGAFYFMSESNKADAERLKQAEIAHQQKLEQQKVEAELAAKTAAEKKAQAELDRIKHNEAVQKAAQDKEHAPDQQCQQRFHVGLPRA